MNSIISYIILRIAYSASTCSSWAGLYQPKAPESIKKSKKYHFND